MSSVTSLLWSPFKQALPSVCSRREIELLPCGNPDGALADSKGWKAGPEKGDHVLLQSNVWVTRCGYKLVRLIHLASGDSANYKGVSAVISYILLAIRFLSMVDHSTKRAFRKDPRK